MSYFTRSLKRLIALPAALIGAVFLSAAFHAMPAAREEAAE